MSHERRPAALLFDLDGTLADSFPGIRLALTAVLEERGMSGVSLEWVRRHVGRGAVELVRDAIGDAVAGAAEERLEEVLGAYLQRYREVYLDATPPLPGAAAVLELVWRRTGGKVAVVSNKNAEFCRGWLEHHGLAAWVAVLAAADTVAARKPDPRAVLPSLDALGVAAADALLVGDMPIDVATGRAAGIPVVAVAAGAASAEELRAAGARDVLDGVQALPGWLADHGLGWAGVR